MVASATVDVRILSFWLWRHCSHGSQLLAWRAFSTYDQPFLTRIIHCSWPLYWQYGIIDLDHGHALIIHCYPLFMPRWGQLISWFSMSTDPESWGPTRLRARFISAAMTRWLPRRLPRHLLQRVQLFQQLQPRCCIPVGLMSWEHDENRGREMWVMYLRLMSTRQKLVGSQVHIPSSCFWFTTEHAWALSDWAFRTSFGACPRNSFFRQLLLPPLRYLSDKWLIAMVSVVSHLDGQLPVKQQKKPVTPIVSFFPCDRRGTTSRHAKRWPCMASSTSLGCTRDGRDSEGAGEFSFTSNWLVVVGINVPYSG